MANYLFTSESVSEGHPDKVADQIADAVLDECISLDPKAHVACEVFVSRNFVLIGGEITINSQKPVNFVEIVKKTLKVLLCLY